MITAMEDAEELGGEPRPRPTAKGAKDAKKNKVKRQPQSAQITRRLAENTMTEEHKPQKISPDSLYCPQSAREVSDPLICGDCSAVICRVCGTPLESSADLGIG